MSTLHAIILITGLLLGILLYVDNHRPRTTAYYLEKAREKMTPENWQEVLDTTAKKKIKKIVGAHDTKIVYVFLDNSIGELFILNNKIIRFKEIKKKQALRLKQ